MADDIIKANQAIVHTRRRSSKSAHTARTDSKTKTNLSATKAHSISSIIHGHVQLSLIMAMRSTTLGTTTLQPHQGYWTLVDTPVTSFSAMDNQPWAAMFKP